MLYNTHGHACMPHISRTQGHPKIPGMVINHALSVAVNSGRFSSQGCVHSAKFRGHGGHGWTPKSNRHRQNSLLTRSEAHPHCFDKAHAQNQVQSGTKPCPAKKHGSEFNGKLTVEKPSADWTRRNVALTHSSGCFVGQTLREFGTDLSRFTRLGPRVT